MERNNFVALEFFHVSYKTVCCCETWQSGFSSVLKELSRVEVLYYYNFLKLANQRKDSSKKTIGLDFLAKNKCYSTIYL